jgi:hypothetical protein
MQASTPSASSSSRRWADYSDDEDDDLSPRSYCEVLRSGTPPSPPPAVVPSPSPVASPSSSPVARGGARPWSAALSLLAAGAGVAAQVGVVVGAAPSRVDSPSGGVDAPVVSEAEIPAGGARPWIHVGGRKRSRGRQEELPAMLIRDDLPPDLAGVCFNCLLPADHISRNCTKETACLRCRKSGHHARDCPQGRAPAGGGQPRRQRRDAGLLGAAPTDAAQLQREPRGASSSGAARGRRELPVSVNVAVEPVRGRPAPAPAPLRGGVHARLGPLGGQSPPSPVVEPGPGPGLYRVPARRRLGVRVPSPPPASPLAPPSSVGSRMLGHQAGGGGQGEQRSRPARGAEPAGFAGSSRRVPGRARSRSRGPVRAPGPGRAPVRRGALPLALLRPRS